jgi:hypothetical protein
MDGQLSAEVCSGQLSAEFCSVISRAHVHGITNECRGVFSKLQFISSISFECDCMFSEKFGGGFIAD